MARILPEWIGKKDDAKVPNHVRLRIFDRFGGRCQCGCGRKIETGEPWQNDHIIALINGGEHRESNMHPLIIKHHAEKTKEDVAIKSATYESRKRHLGLKKARRTIPGRKFDGTPIPSRIRT